ncbi:uncharacterized protein LOC126734313 [Anthonomus grandis grandis]|uniref:uncharacterized protein LOC126734313 n=1 Tax=Anthonomus grandis grandis TaxID=2921223 RepID=UPI0021661BB6|nr:uncharacterized protein LOC126734313 [Anthonomus grandis grandis]
MEDLRKLKIKRGNIKGYLTRTKSFLDSIDLDYLTELNLIQIKTRLDNVEPLLCQFNDVQSDIECQMTLESQSDEDSSKIFEEESLNRTSVVINNNAVSTHDAQNVVPSKPSIKLPDLKLPVFNGSYEKWLEFRDAFQAIVHKNVHLSDVEKFFYLKSFLEGEPLQAIANLQVTNDNYSNAWSILSDRSLKSLGQEVDQWDTLIVFMLINKFDSVTRREWESFPIKGELPGLEDVNKFLKAKCELLEKLEASKQDVNKMKLCSNCFSPDHTQNNCPKSNICRQCGEKHNSLLHLNIQSPVAPVHSRPFVSVNSPPPVTNGIENSTHENAVALSATIGEVNHVDSNVKATLSLLVTAKIRVFDSRGNIFIIRALLDPGSQSNFISESLVSKLGLKRQNVDYEIRGLAQALLATSSSRVNVTIMSNICDDFKEIIPCLVISKITQDLPYMSFNISQWKIPGNISLADDTFNVRGNIDMLLGNDIFYRILLMNQICSPGMPVLQNSRLGWIVAGNFNPKCIPVSENRVLACHSFEQSIDQSLTKFWELEECESNSKVLSKSEQDCEEHFVSSFARNSEGRFVVKYPFKENLHQLGFSKQMAYKRLIYLEKRLLKDEVLKEDYIAFLNEYRDLGHMTKVKNFSIDSSDSNKYCYLPHHAVVKEGNLTTKVRVVFDASAQTDTGLSLNDVQHVGPTIQNDLLAILLNFRIYPFVINADITKMYRQVLIDPSQRGYQRILWKNIGDLSAEIECFELNTVTYGCASSPFLAVRCLYQLGLEYKDKYPKASQAIMNCFYLDDLLAGEFSQAALLQLQHEISFILNTAGFKLRKWLSNKSELVSQFEIDKNEFSSILQLGEGQQNKTLGLFWDAAQDSIHYSIINGDVPKRITKRLILSITSQIFDPLGLLGPIIVVAKLILQTLWQNRLSWDESVPQSLAERWLEFYKDLQFLSQVNVPRYVLADNWKILQVHGFADASEKAYGGCVYLVSFSSTGEYISSHLILAKSRVAPLKKITLPRLELCAAVVTVKLVEKVRNSICVSIDHCVYWTDSSIALCWIQACPSRWKTFVANRVTEVQNLSIPENWHHIRSEMNPADCLSRGTSAAYLLSLELWWKGPIDIFSSPPPDMQNLIEPKFDIPEQRVLSHYGGVEETFEFDFLRYSALLKLQRIISYCFRFYHRLKSKVKKNGPISSDELNCALICLLRICQLQSFSKEYVALKRKDLVSNSSRILCLNPFLDNEGLIRVGGRIQRANISTEQKHPIILHPKHMLTSLILRLEHVKLLHCGPQQLLYSIRQRFWPISGRRICRSIVRSCVVCFKAKPISQNYLMGSLPESRLTAFQPVFTHTGIDYAGPISIRDRKTRNPKILKAYICIFVCMSTKCVHLDVVTDLTTSAFIAVLKRFIARRGKPLHIYSDNGSNFVGANSVLFDFLRSNSDKIGSTLSTESISWHFNPPRAPNFGGLGEAGVKGFKFHLKRIMGDSKLSYEDLSTVIIQIEGVLNSRPISPLSTDPQDPTPLTPGHFLVGKPLTAIPEPVYTEVAENRLNKYQSLQAMIQHFWKRWSLEYISELQSRLKWKKSYVTLLKVGSLVIVKKDNVPVCKWKVGRVLELHPGPDNITRVVTLKCADGSVYKRAISKICVLPVE